MVRITAYKEQFREKFIDFLNGELSHGDAEKAAKKLESRNENVEYLVCLDDDENILGFIVYTLELSGVMRLDYVYVGKNFRRDKNGSLLLVAIMQRAVNRLICGLVCECKSENTDGLAFLKALGFTVSQEKDGVKYLSKSLLHMYKVKPSDK